MSPPPGKKVSGFTDTEEDAVKGMRPQLPIPFSLEAKLKELGCVFERGADWGAQAVIDGKLVTGQNPASSEKVAELMMTAF